MKTTPLAMAAALLAASLGAGTAAAGEHGRRQARSGGPADPTYLKECGACHVAYPPRFLPAGALGTLLGGLEHHFGQDASLEPEVLAGLERWALAQAKEAHARTGESLRVTEQPWFLHEHDEVPAGAASRPTIRSLANCGACHPGAERWDFDEDGVRIPRR